MSVVYRRCLDLTNEKKTKIVLDLIQKGISPFIKIIDEHKPRCKTKILDLRNLCLILRNSQQVAGMHNIDIICRKSDLLVLAENHVDVVVSKLMDAINANIRTCQQNIMELTDQHDEILETVNSARNCVLKMRQQRNLYSFVDSTSNHKKNLEHDFLIGMSMLSELKPLFL